MALGMLPGLLPVGINVSICSSCNSPIVVADLGYTDYTWYADLIRQQVFFVTRQKRRAAYKVTASRTVNQKQGLISDQTIRLTGAKAQECPYPLRRIVFKDP